MAANREARPDNVLEDDAGHEFAVIHGASDAQQIQGNSAQMEMKKLTAVMQAFQIDPASRSRVSVDEKMTSSITRILFSQMKIWWE